MKRLCQTLLAGCLLSGIACGATPPETRIESLRAQNQVHPVFPDDLVRIGVREGEVRLALSVDNLGNLEDLLVLSHTHPRFAEVTLNAVKKWRFEPVKQNGEPVAATTLLTVKFEAEGVVVTSTNAHEQAAQLFASLMQNRFHYRIHSLRELDQIPTPIAAPAPGRAKGITGEVAVGFYIDETGAVRIPSVDADAHPILASLAIEALRQWRFEPPRRKGVPVLVRATQVFKFTPESKAGER